MNNLSKGLKDGDLEGALELDLLADKVTLIDLADRIPNDVNPNDCIALADNVIPLNAVQKMRRTGLQHVLQLDATDLKSELSFCSKIIEAPLEFFRDPIGGIFSNRNVEVKIVQRFTSTDEKEETLEKTLHFLKEQKGGTVILDAASRVAEELFTNAIYNAHVAAQGDAAKPVKRGGSVHMRGGKHALLVGAKDQQRLLVGCMDPYGKLDTDGLLKSMESSFEKGIGASINRGDGGAGIGLRLALESSESFYVVVMNGVATFVGATFLLGKSLTKSTPEYKNLHFVKVA